MEELMIGGIVAVGALIFTYFDDKRSVKGLKENDKRLKEQKARQAEYDRIEKARIDQIESERTRLLSKIVTSSNNSIRGYRILRHIQMVSIVDEQIKTIAEGKFLLAVEEAGGNGVLNMQVRPHRGGYFSVQGDAVLVEKT